MSDIVIVEDFFYLIKCIGRALSFPKCPFFVFKNDDMSKVSYYTAEGLKNLREELNHLKDVERPKGFAGDSRS